MSVPAPTSGRRGLKAAVDPWRPLGSLWERERTAAGSEEVLTVFLAGAECPFACVFCDLWRHTLDGPTPPGALPRQLALALARAGRRPQRIKLYNASNFFEPRAVPPQEDGELAALLAGIPAVTVECHPRLVGERCFAFAAALSGRLEVAMGLETVHPEALPRLGKRMTLADFDRAAASLARHDIDLRAFVLLGVPFVPAAEQVEWAVCGAAHAVRQGARHVSLIPVRPGNPELDRLARGGEFEPPRLAGLEAALERCLAARPSAIVTADLWEAARFAACPACRAARLARLQRMNEEGSVPPPLACDACRAGPA